jgi:hypothetical protein
LEGDSPGTVPVVLAVETVLAPDMLVSLLCTEVEDSPDGVEGVESNEILGVKSASVLETGIRDFNNQTHDVVFLFKNPLNF